MSIFKFKQPLRSRGDKSDISSHWIYEFANCDCAIYAQYKSNNLSLIFPTDKMAQLYDTETLVTRMLLRGMIEYLTSSTQLDSLFESAEFGHHQ